jgi:hypothetical protein
MKNPFGRIIPAPIPSNPHLRPVILDGVCALNEDVEWHWRLTAQGMVASGYSIRRRSGSMEAFPESMEAPKAAPRRSRKRVVGA